MTLSDLFRRAWNSIALGDSERLSVESVQDHIESAIIRSGARTKYTRTIVFGNTMLISISPAAMDVVSRVQRQVLLEIQEHLPTRLSANGWTLPQRELSLNLVADSSLAGLEMAVRVVDADVTPEAIFASPAGGATVGDSAVMRLVELDGRGREWVIDPGRPWAIGSSPPPDSPEFGSLVIDGRYISRVHLVAYPQVDPAPFLIIKDDRSKHGTAVNGKVLSRTVEARVEHGDVIHLAVRTGSDGRRLRFVVGRPESDLTQRLAAEPS